MSIYKVTDSELTSIANAIRAKSGESGELQYPLGFNESIEGISVGDLVISNGTEQSVKSDTTIAAGNFVSFDRQENNSSVSIGNPGTSVKTNGFYGGVWINIGDNKVIVIRNNGTWIIYGLSNNVVTALSNGTTPASGVLSGIGRTKNNNYIIIIGANYYPFTIANNNVTWGEAVSRGSSIATTYSNSNFGAFKTYGQIGNDTIVFADAYYHNSTYSNVNIVAMKIQNNAVVKQGTLATTTYKTTQNVLLIPWDTEGTYFFFKKNTSTNSSWYLYSNVIVVETTSDFTITLNNYETGDYENLNTIASAGSVLKIASNKYVVFRQNSANIQYYVISNTSIQSSQKSFSIENAIKAYNNYTSIMYGITTYSVEGGTSSYPPINIGYVINNKIYILAWACVTSTDRDWGLCELGLDTNNELSLTNWLLLEHWAGSKTYYQSYADGMCKINDTMYIGVSRIEAFSSYCADNSTSTTQGPVVISFGGGGSGDIYVKAYDNNSIYGVAKTQITSAGGYAIIGD